MKSTEIKKRINRVSLAILVFIGLLSAMQSVLILLKGIFDELWGAESVKNEVVYGLLFGLIYILGYLGAYFVFKISYSEEFMPARLNANVGKHPVAMIFASVSVCFMASHLVGYFGGGNSSATVYHDQSIVILLFSTVLIPAFCEELFFRGLIMTNLLPLGRNFSIIASGIIFGLVHGNHDQILFATFAGIVFGWLYAETGTVWCGVLAHMLNNLISVIETVLWGTLKTATAVKMNMLIEAVILICGVVSILYLITVLKKEKEEEFANGVFGKITGKLLDGGTRFAVTDYIKGFFSPAMIAFLCYVAVNEVVYVFLN